MVDQDLVLPSNIETVDKTRKFKLPKSELKKFAGDARKFVGFWSQFSKIHESPNFAPEDKFHYLAQYVVSNSRATQLVNSFSSTATN